MTAIAIRSKKSAFSFLLYPLCGLLIVGLICAALFCAAMVIVPLIVVINAGTIQGWMLLLGYYVILGLGWACSADD